jgi:hypothetical protein
VPSLGFSLVLEFQQFVLNRTSEITHDFSLLSRSREANSPAREVRCRRGAHLGFQLDIHSRLTSDGTIALANGVLRRAPRLGAVTFELLKEAVPLLGHDAISDEPSRT